MVGTKIVLDYCSTAVQGSVKKGLNLLGQIKNKPKYVKEYEQRIHRRFFSNKPKIPILSKNPWVRRVINAFHRHWIDVLSESVEPEKSKEELKSSLNVLLGTNESEFDVIDLVLENRLQEHELYYSGDCLHPNIRSAYIYASQENKTYVVTLPQERILKLPVYFMDDFLCKDWISFATLGRSSAGGWARIDSLYCVANTYDLESDNFKLTYLKHEAQHTDDYLRYPRLAPRPGYPSSEEKFREALFFCSVKEYRAKLVEIIYAKSKSSLIDFISQAADYPNSPHCTAAKKIVTGLSGLLGIRQSFDLIEVSRARLAEAANELFSHSTNWLESLGDNSIGTAKSVLDVTLE